MLATSGLLNQELFGKSVKPPQPDGLWKAVSMPDSYPRYFEADSGAKIYRRSVYTFWKRGMAPPQMTILGCAFPRSLHCSPRTHEHTAAGIADDERKRVLESSSPPGT